MTGGGDKQIMRRKWLVYDVQKGTIQEIQIQMALGHKASLFSVHGNVDSV